MTSKVDEIRTLAMTRIFLAELTNAKATPKVPATIRQRAHRLLMQYPFISTIITKEIR